jgi:hypothetical protein
VEWHSFTWGATATAAVIALWSGFFKKAGEALFALAAARLKPPRSVQVDGKFVPTLYAPGSCAWINELKLYDREQEGFTYYPYGKRSAKCFRITSDGREVLKEFLMVQPGAVAIDA